MLTFIRIVRQGLAALVLVGYPAADLASQVATARWQDSSALAIIRSTLPKEDVLRQQIVPLPRAVLDEIADSLVADILAASAPGTDSGSKMRAHIQVLNLVYAGAVKISGTPYAGAQARLMKVARDGGTRDVRSTAVFLLLETEPLRDAVDFMARETLRDLSDSGVGFAVLSNFQNAWDMGVLRGRAITSAELDVVTSGIKQLWQGMPPKPEGKLSLVYRNAVFILDRVACLEGWEPKFQPCTVVAPKRIPGAPVFVPWEKRSGGGGAGAGEERKPEAAPALNALRFSDHPRTPPPD